MKRARKMFISQGGSCCEQYVTLKNNKDRHMKIITKVIGYPLMMAALFFYSTIQSQTITTPRNASPAAEVSQTIGLSKITVNYSRPKLTTTSNVDRSGQIWGQLVPYGFTTNFLGTEMPWRAGANENTIISFSDDVKIEGKDLVAGSYGLHMEIHEDGKVTLIFSSNTTSWGSYYYKESEDVLRVDVMSKQTARTEVLTYDFVNFGKDFTVLSLKWDEKEIPMKIELATDDLMMQNITNELRDLPGFGWQGHLSAAQYTLNNNTHLDQGLVWVDVAVQRNPNFQTLTTKAAILNAMGKTDEANVIFDQAGQGATVAQINALGYQFLAAKQYDKAIEFFKINVKNDPTNANGYDSLGDGYKATGEKEKAIKNYKKALTLNPAANVKAASEASLKELGAN